MHCLLLSVASNYKRNGFQTHGKQDFSVPSAQSYLRVSGTQDQAIIAPNSGAKPVTSPVTSHPSTMYGLFSRSSKQKPSSEPWSSALLAGAQPSAGPASFLLAVLRGLSAAYCTRLSASSASKPFGDESAQSIASERGEAERAPEEEHTAEQHDNMKPHGTRAGWIQTIFR